MGLSSGMSHSGYFWSLLALKCFYRILARHVASRSLWNGRSSELLQEYMGANGNESSFNPGSCNPDTMEGYKYFVYGESQQSKKNGHGLSVKDLRSQVTLDKIWQCDDSFLPSSINMKGKDLSLAFALYRLLRCRLEGATLHAATVHMNRKLVSKRFLSDNAGKELFDILELDVEFLRDSLHTSYPMVFCRGLLSLSFTLLLSLVKVSMASWLYAKIGKVYYPKSELDKARGSLTYSFRYAMHSVISGTELRYHGGSHVHDIDVGDV